MAVQLKQQMTTAEFDVYALLPENADRLLEFIGGELYEVVSNPYSSKIASTINFYLHLHLKEKGLKGHITGADGGYIVAGERYIPDVAYIRYERQPQLSYHDGYNPLAPDLAVEVLSPANSAVEMRLKLANYASAGTTVWVVDPEAQTVEVYVPGQPARLLGSKDTLDGGTVLPGFALAVKDIFPAAEAS